MRNRLTHNIIAGARHFDVIMRMQMLSMDEEERLEWKKSEQGFIDQFGNFLTRQEAWVIANERGQIFRRCGGDEGKLFSENLY